ncbi:MAG: hypothetical protein R2873_24035 [Caldilineaceae bacterium]
MAPPRQQEQTLSWLQPPVLAQDFCWTATTGAGAHLLVINHALLLADLQAKGTSCTKYDHLIVDEAHRLKTPPPSSSPSALKADDWSFICAVCPWTKS